MHPYLIPLSELFQKNANQEIAFYMKKYMKGQYAYFGIKSPERRELKKEFLQTYGLPGLKSCQLLLKNAGIFRSGNTSILSWKCLKGLLKKQKRNELICMNT